MYLASEGRRVLQRIDLVEERLMKLHLISTAILAGTLATGLVLAQGAGVATKPAATVATTKVENKGAEVTTRSGKMANTQTKTVKHRHSVKQAAKAEPATSPAS